MMDRLRMGGLACGVVLVVLAGLFQPAQGEVIISDERTETVSLDKESNPSSEKTAIVTDTGYVHVVESDRAYGIIIKDFDGLTLQTDKNGRVETKSSLGAAVHFDNTGTVINNGTIAAYRYSTYSGQGIEMQFGTVTNTGSILSEQKRAIYFTGADPNRINTVYNTGTIYGQEYGINSSSALNVTNEAGASIFGGIEQPSGALSSPGDSTITNYGTINTSQYVGNGLRLKSGTVQNLGKDSLIYGGATGVTLAEAAVTGENKVTNEGLIGSNTIGVYLTYGGIVENSGTIWGEERGKGIYIYKGAATITNSGTIRGETGIQFSRRDSYDDILDNSGTIIGTGESAVNMEAGNDTAIFRRGTIVTGWVDGGDGADILEFNDAGTQKDFMAMHFETLNFTGGETILTGAGSSANVGGDTTVKSGATAGIEGFTFNTGTLKVESTGKLINRGAINVTGAYTQASDSVYEVGAAPDHNFAKVKADKADIQGGTIIFNTDSVRGGKHLIVGTTSGLNGTYDQYEYNTGTYVIMSHEYDPNGRDMYAIVASVLTDITRPMTRNQLAVSRYLDNARNSPYASAFISDDMWGIYDLLNHGLDVPTVRSAYDQMGGASHTVFAAIDQARQVHFFRTLFRREGVLPVVEPSLAGEGRNPFLQVALSGERATDAAFAVPKPEREAFPWNLWIKGYGAFGGRRGEDIASRYDYSIGGLVTGADRRLGPGLRGGVAVGYARTKMDMKDWRNNNGGEDSFQGALYGSFERGQRYLDAALSFAYNRYDTVRPIVFGGLSRTASGSYEGREFSGYAEGGYRTGAGGFRLTPFVSFLALRSHRDGFTETGADSLNLSAEGADTTSLQGALGARVSRTFAVSDTLSLTPEASVRWTHEFGDTDARLEARLAGTLVGSGPFTVYSDEGWRDGATVSLGISAAIGEAWRLFAYYDGEFKSDWVNQAVTGGVEIRW